MKLFAVGAALLLAIIVTLGASGASRPSCVVGKTRSFVSMNSEPFLIGRLPNKFTAESRFFARRYNCKKFGVQAKRVNTGVYDVLMPGIGFGTSVATSLSPEGIASSALYLERGIYRITLRDVNGQLRDVAFSLVVY